MLDDTKLRIAFDISQTGKQKAGCGYFAHTLVASLLEHAPQHHYTLHPSFGDFYLDPNMPKKNPYTSGDYGPLHKNHAQTTAYWCDPALESRLGHPDLIHANNFWCPTQLKTSKLFYTLYDLGFLIEPKWTTEANRLGCFDGVFKASLFADWIVAISEFSKQHFLNTFPYFPEDRIRVIYPRARYHAHTSSGTRPQQLNQLEPNQFWLSVGTIEPRKNQNRLAEAYASYLAQGGKPMPLVFAGMNGWLMDDFRAHLKQLQLEHQVILTGYLDDDALIWLYRNCYANLYPSWFEGFGLPVLEGMQLGAATLASHVSSIPEITKDAAILISPHDTQAWAQQMLNLSQKPELRETLREAASKQAMNFHQQQSPTHLPALYQLAHQSPKRLKGLICG